MDSSWIKGPASAAHARILELASQLTSNSNNLPKSTITTTTMPNTKTVDVPHLGGITAAYQTPHPYDPAKPTLVLVNSFTTSSELYRSQYANTHLTDAMNLIAIELLGHGQTRTERENWTYWDTAIMNVQVLDALGMTGEGKKVLVLGTSQGGWITVRMALVAPEKVGVVLLSFSFIWSCCLVSCVVAVGCTPSQQNDMAMGTRAPSKQCIFPSAQREN